MLARAQSDSTDLATGADRLAALFDWTPEPIKDPASKRAAILDFGFLTQDGLAVLAAFPARIGTRVPPPPALSLLPETYQWKDPRTGQQRIPLPLCEFLAYKAALSYERSEIIRHNLESCCQGIEHFKFFDTDRQTNGEVDTQGFGFVYEGKAFIILRGSASDTDWEGNFNDALTDVTKFTGDRWQLSAANAKPLARGDTTTAGCHLGFAIGWTAAAGLIEDWIASLPSGDQYPFVFAGHSLGGALACLGAFDFANRPVPRRVAAVVTFGAPRVGNGVFAKLYNERLGHQTVRVESTDDSVPDLMGRWYYPVASAARQMVKQRTWRTAFPDYAPVGLAWEFPEAPAISRAALLSALKSTEEALSRAEEERARKSREDAERSRKQDTKQSAPQGGKDAAPAESPDTQAPGSAAPGGKEGQGDGRWVLWVFGGIFIAVTALCLWLFVRHKIASHGAAQRYAAYLSTLSYRRIRALSSRNLEAANTNLVAYLRFIRGDTDVGKKLLDQPAGTIAAPTTFYTVIEALPVLLQPDDKIEVFLREKSNIIC